jgi:DMSO/TMAO reductase YedYZ molybdopterin-dependent catalytic subunit
MIGSRSGRRFDARSEEQQGLVPQEDGGSRFTRRAAFALGGATAGAVADLVSHEERLFAFRNHGVHSEFPNQPITPLGSHYLLIQFDIAQLSDAGYVLTIGGRVNTPMTLSLDALERQE